MQIYFIRHGESTNNALWDITDDYYGDRSPSPELSERGQQQAQLLGVHLSKPFLDLPAGKDYPNHGGFGLTHLYCSMMVRAVQTAMPAAQALGLTLTTMPTIHEYGGIFKFDGPEKRIGLAGHKQAELAELFPDLQFGHEVAEAGWWNYREEDSAELYRRAGEALNFLIDTHGENDRVAFVSHGGFYQAFMANLLGLTPENPYPSRKPRFGFSINNTGITRISVTDTGTSLVYANNTVHLPPHLITR